MNLEDIDQPPVFPDCAEQKDIACIFEMITSHFNVNFDTQVVDNVLQEMEVIELTFIVDSFGKVRNAMARANDVGIQKESIRVLNQLSDLKPGYHEGAKVNTIIHMPYFVRPKGSPPPKLEDYDTPAIAKDC